MTEIHSFQPLLDNTTELTRFRGTYFLTEFESRIGDEQHYWKLALADSSGELTVYCYDPEFIQDHIAAGMYVQVEVVRKSTRGCEFVQCVQLHSWEREQEKRKGGSGQTSHRQEFDQLAVDMTVRPTDRPSSIVSPPRASL